MTEVGIDVRARFQLEGEPVLLTPPRRRPGPGGVTSTVYRCTRAGQAVAVKVKQGPALPEVIEAEARITNEASTLAPGSTVEVLDWGWVEHALVIVLPFLHRNAVQVVQRECAAGVACLDSVVARVAAALDALSQLHAAGIVHRDIKADCLRARGDAWLWTDFSVASSATVSGPAGASREFRAPEQCEDQPGTAQSDQFSAGLVLFYYLLLNDRHVEEVALRALLHARARRFDALALASALGACDAYFFGDSRLPALRDALGRMLAWDPAGRFPDAAHAATALRASLADPTGDTHRPGWMRAVARTFGIMM